MVNLTLEEALAQAQSHARHGNKASALSLYRAILNAIPNHDGAQKGMAALEGETSLPEPAPQDLLNELISLYQQGQLEVVAIRAEALVTSLPDSVLLRNIIGVVNMGLKRFKAAENAFREALRLNPEYADAHNNLGAVLKEQGQLDDAAKSYKRALEIKPDYADAHNNLGVIMQEQGNLNEALQCYKQALKINPNYAQPYCNIGNIYHDQGILNIALENYTSALQINPQHNEALIQHALLLARVCRWRDVDSESTIQMLGITGEIESIFGMFSLEDAPARHKLRSENWTTTKYTQSSLPVLPAPAQQPAKLRIGYFSADFRAHPVMYLMCQVLAEHDRDRFEIIAYSYGPDQADPVRDRSRAAVDEFIDVRSLSDLEVAEHARANKIDIAIDLTGYTEHCRSGIFAYRAAPIQINYLGYPGTMGADFMDYIIADQQLIPPSSQQYYSEKPLYLPHHYQAQDDSLAIASETPSRESLGLPEEGFVFCAINSSYKITPSVFSIWMRLLDRVEGSVLWLLKSNEWAQENLLKEASARGIDPQRLVFADKVSHDVYLARFRQADLYLDTFVYNAGATASNALWAGLPVLTKRGEGYTARMAGSLLSSLGVEELITETEESYEALALALAEDPVRLETLRAKVCAQRETSPLFKTALFTRHLERGYEQAYERYFSGQTPAEIVVEPIEQAPASGYTLEKVLETIAGKRSW